MSLHQKLWVIGGLAEFDVECPHLFFSEPDHWRLIVLNYYGGLTNFNHGMDFFARLRDFYVLCFGFLCD